MDSERDQSFTMAVQVKGLPNFINNRIELSGRCFMYMINFHGHHAPVDDKLISRRSSAGPVIYVVKALT